MTEVLPMNVISRGAFVLYFLLRLFSGGVVQFRRTFRGLTFSAFVFNILCDLQPVLWNVLLANVRFITHPCHAAPTEKPVLDRVFHRCAKVGIVLNLKV